MKWIQNPQYHYSLCFHSIPIYNCSPFPLHTHSPWTLLPPKRIQLLQNPKIDVHKTLPNIGLHPPRPTNNRKRHHNCPFQQIFLILARTPHPCSGKPSSQIQLPAYTTTISVWWILHSLKGISLGRNRHVLALPMVPRKDEQRR